MDNKKLAELMFPNIDKDIEYYEQKYPNRNLPKGAIVTRFAPSPTGFVHMGSLRTAFIARKIATDTGGVFYLRIEDTDEKRSVENGIQGIVEDLENFNFIIDEGRISETKDLGIYGPYLQSERASIYKTFAKHLVEKGFAYPCFATEEELSKIRQFQESKKERIGYYGLYAKSRNFEIKEIESKILSGEKFVTRLKSPGNFSNKVICADLVKGKIEFPENDLDIVLLKSDGIPTYHFAHLVDDYLMRTTHILRGDEWLSSYPVHEQLFKIFGYELPKYCHVAPVNKKDGDSVRKLSKRHDPEAALSYYHEKGIPINAVYLYLMTTANSNFEEWLEQNPKSNLNDYKFEFKKMSASGSLFDLDKLINISKNYISKLSAKEVYDEVINWTKIYDKEFYDILINNKALSIDIFNIEREQKKPRKDFASWSEIKENVFYMFDDYFDYKKVDFSLVNNPEKYKELINLYIDKYYNESDDKNTWFRKIKELSTELGYAPEMNLYKENPTKYKGNVADVSNILRVALTTKTTTPDLYEIMRLLGKEKIAKRFNDLSK
ncbi:MAG: glutamate--tRNA ligase [Bacilli bacterium]|nr:glutamate--tRNA ligase [Bacilli bacterium]